MQIFTFSVQWRSQPFSPRSKPVCACGCQTSVFIFQGCVEVTGRGCAPSGQKIQKQEQERPIEQPKSAQVAVFTIQVMQQLRVDRSSLLKAKWLDQLR